MVHVRPCLPPGLSPHGHHPDPKSCLATAGVSIPAEAGLPPCFVIAASSGPVSPPGTRLPEPGGLGRSQHLQSPATLGTGRRLNPLLGGTLPFGLWLFFFFRDLCTGIPMHPACGTRPQGHQPPLPRPGRRDVGHPFLTTWLLLTDPCLSQCWGGAGPVGSGSRSPHVPAGGGRQPLNPPGGAAALAVVPLGGRGVQFRAGPQVQGWPRQGAIGPQGGQSEEGTAQSPGRERNGGEVGDGAPGRG